MAIIDAALDIALKCACGPGGYEGFDRFARLDTMASVPVWTIGHGTTRINGQPVRQGMSCTLAQADQWAKQDMHFTAAFVQSHICVPMTACQFAAMISLAYNLGPAGFARSDVCHLFNAGQTREAADAFLLYDHAGGHAVDGLENRRKRERALFLGGADAVPASGPPSLADQLNQKELDQVA